jgi:hypothetical protein
VLAFAAPAPLFAQDSSAVEQARIHVGPFGFTPRIAIRNLGVDTNVLHTPGTAQHDFTVSFVPGVDSWIRVGRAHVAARTSVDWTYFQKTVAQRSVDVSQDGRVEIRLNRLTPHFFAGYIRSKQPPNLEIDRRMAQTNTTSAVGTAVKLGDRLSLDVEGNRRKFAFDRVAGATSFAEELNRTSTGAKVSARYAVTSLTTFVVETTVTHDRFESGNLRNSNTLIVTPGLEFKPLALISGSAFVGYRRFNALGPTLPDFSGLTAAVNLTFIARESTKFAVRADRTLEYSFSETQPYFIATGGTLTVTQMIGTGWDVMGRAGRTNLAYRSVVTASADPTVVVGRRDRVGDIGLGLGRHLGSDLRIGFEVDYGSRFSVVEGRGYHGFRFGGTVTYGS